MKAAGRVRKWTFWFLAVAIASQFYWVREVLAAFSFFAIGFAALVFVVLSLYLLQKGWGIAVARIFNGERWMPRDPRPAMIWLAGQDVARSKSAQELKTESRNSKDWNGKGTLNWVAREKWVERI